MTIILTESEDKISGTCVVTPPPEPEPEIAEDEETDHGS